MPKSFNSRPKKLSTTSLINNNHDSLCLDHACKKKKKIFRPSYPIFFWHVTGNTLTFLFSLSGLIFIDTKEEMEACDASIQSKFIFSSKVE